MSDLDDVLSLRTWGIPFESLLVVAGPCSAENREQLSATAEALSSLPVNVLRAGLWKPRTHPDSFQGVGEAGLEWLDEVRRTTGLRVATEVAEPAHVELCLDHRIDVLWIGARTTGNPFSVQAIADALGGIDVPVMVKNPLVPDIELWVGALQRLNRAGIRRLAGVHRGFVVHRPSRFRFPPEWRIPIELRRRAPELPILCDPSHICGRSSLIPGVAQSAVDLAFDGLMVEAHTDPPRALSDVDQQLSPGQLQEVLEGLTHKRSTIKAGRARVLIEGLREQIDDIDAGLIDLVVRRMELAREIGEHKRAHGITIFQPERWDELLRSRLALATGRGLEREFVFRLFEAIHEESIRQQEQENEEIE